MKKTAILLMIITILSKIIGFGREITLSYFYGASNVSDAYLIALTVPSVIFSFLGTGISTGYIPMYSKIRENHGEAEANRYTNNLSNILIIVCTILMIFGLMFTDQIVKIFASGFKGETLALAVKFTRISLWGIYFTALISPFSGFLQLKGNYTVPALIAFPMNFFILLSIPVSYKTNTLVLAIGSTIATMSQLLFLAPFIYKEGYRYRFIVDFKDKYVKNMVYLALPITIGVSVNQINTLVDRTLASNLAVGGITALNYAQRLNGFVQGIFVSSISAVMYPMISKMVAEKNTEGLKKTISEAILIISLLVMPATVGSMIYSKQIITLLFGRGAFDVQATSMTADALLFYSMGMIGFGLRDILSRGFYSLQDTKTPMVNAALAMGINIVLNIVLSKFLGIGGLALATSISAIVCTALLFVSFRKKIGSFGMKYLGITFSKITAASLIMGMIAKVSYELLLKSISGNLALFISIGIGAMTYFILIYFMKIEEVDSLIKAFKKKFKK